MILKASPTTTDRRVIETVKRTLAAHDGLSLLYDPPAEKPKRGSVRPLSESSLDPAIVRYLKSQHPDGLFNHQHAAIEGVLNGRNLVVATRTSSGKSLIYSLPALDALCRDPHATALLIYPQKALANDQLVKLRAMLDQVTPVRALAANKPLLASRYDGSTADSLKSTIRQDVQILITNPDMLHLGILQHHNRHWARFFAHLQLVAIDECHEYRGVFGTNVAYILHRLRQVCAQHGSSPRFVATSATVCDPRGHLERLTGVDFECVGPERDGSLQGRRKFWMVGSADHYYDTGRKLASALAESGLTVLAFCPSRIAAERMIARLPRSETDENGYVRVYRSGLSAEQRESIEQGLRDRSVRLVFSTSALELGIDIGEIDVTLCIGLPPTTIEHSLQKRYPFPAIRGRRITRLEEADLGPFRLDGETAERLAEDNIGVFIGGCRDWDWMMDKLNILADTRYPARWLVVLATKQLAETVYGNLALKPDRRERIHVPTFWDHHNVTYTTPEGLDSCRGIVKSNGPPAAVLLVDPVCHGHKARDWFVPGRGVHDRPQRIADFRADLGRNGRSPPFLVLTRRPAKSVSTLSMVSAYCLDALWFVDGGRLRVGQPPVTSLQSSNLQSLRLAI